MVLPMLVVDKNIEISQREQAEWKKHGIGTIRVDTMQEAIEKLTKESFLFTAINADNTNYLPLLKTMRVAAFITCSNYSTQKEVEALHNGADVFTAFNEDVELNVQLALAQLLRCNERDKPPKTPSGMIIYENFLILSKERRIFCNDERIKLTKKEYQILNYLITNHDCRLTYEQIYLEVWGHDFDGARYNALWDYILKIRKKLKKVTGGNEYIKNERDVGYIFSAWLDK